ncbi:glycosyltransferase family 2 protein [Barnesiella sp. WM24]|uniref:glycosyltransferase family 2 protein n=1 Tax=Barnesiella sp. WM24 TaxID=2558278 RepID=UPI0010718DE2|nr:glycosyltransferase [Barnesiella sp. WM24]MDE6114989.1 glycosyltransferase [Muribaculum sp.]TFU93751.1 glycosyltransferase family 2 protein [Barnesiella sp. WM24]
MIESFFKGVLYDIFELLNGIMVCFSTNLSWEVALSTFWFLFIIEFPRYYLLDIITALRHVFLHKSLRRRDIVARNLLYTEMPLVSILAPGKNEGRHIYKLVESLREQTYQNFEIIIVDDGSDDATPIICNDLQRAGYITKFFRLNLGGGKACAANFAASHASGKYIIHLDADSSLDRDAIEKILIPFYFDRNIKGVGGCIKVRNAHESLCSTLQALEYLKTIMVGRMGSNMLGIYHIISGAFGAFETEAIREVGCWDIGPGLDGDITQKLRKAGYKVWFANDAVCMTNVPTSWMKLFKQRKRWSKSLVRFRIRKHKDILWSDRNFSFLNMLSNMENILYDFAFNYVWFFYIIMLFFMNVDRLWEIIVIGYLIRMAFAIIAFGVILIITERPREEAKLFPYVFITTFYTGYFLRITRLIAHTSELFFYSSYKDAWNPKKTSAVARAEGL